MVNAGAQSQNFIKYQNITYRLIVSLTSDDKLAMGQNCEVLDVNDISMLKYESSLNRLLANAQLTYVDKYSKIDRFLDQQYIECEISFGEVIKKSDGNIDENCIDPNKHMHHTFIVQSIKPIDRQEACIKYQIDMTSIYWKNCIANIAYSNYNSSSKSIFDILKSCMSKAQLPVDIDTFKSVTTDVSMDYATVANDNVLSIFKYLMHKLYFLPKKDSSMKYIMFDLIQNKYKLLDISHLLNGFDTSSVIVSFFKSNVESLATEEPNNLGAFTESTTQTDLYKDLFEKQIYSYDLSKNSFKLTNSSSKKIANYINANIGMDEYATRYKNINFNELQTYYKTGSYWSSDMDVYNKSFDAMTQNNAVILNAAGDIQRQPGAFVDIVVDRSTNAVTDDSRSDLEKMKLKYKVFEGLWIASKVVNIIEPITSRFRQQVALFRNFTLRRKTPPAVPVIG